MLKKTLSIIITLILLLSTHTFSTKLASAEAEDKSKQVLDNCKELIPEYPSWEEPLVFEPEDDYDFAFRLEFETARIKYHDYVNCIFEEAVLTIVGSVVERLLGMDRGDTEGLFGAHVPNLPEFLKPESSCSKEQKLADVLKGSSPEVLLTPLMEAYNGYVDHLDRLFEKVSSNPTIAGSTVSDFTELYSRNQKFYLIVQNEVQNAIVAMDSAFISLKELRQAFVMHIHFQCMLKNLEFYRKALENLRNVVSVLPSVISDASMHK